MSGQVSGVDRLRAALEESGLTFDVLELERSTRTAADAARTIGCSVAQIGKSIVFRAEPSGRAVLVIASGANRIDEAAVSALLDEAIGKADADFVRRETGYAIGGVAPVGHKSRPVTIIDRDLMRFDEIWAAAGSPYSVFKLTPAALVRLTDGTVAEIALQQRRTDPS